MSALFTHGPWSIDPGARNTTIRDAEGSYICEADIGAMDGGYQDALHDLNLIAAAPTLYDAVAAAESYFATLPADDDVVHPLYRQMNDALAFARGERL